MAYISYSAINTTKLRLRLAVRLGDGLLGNSLLDSDVAVQTQISSTGGRREVGTVELVRSLVGDRLSRLLGVASESDLDHTLGFIGLAAGLINDKFTHARLYIRTS